MLLTFFTRWSECSTRVAERHLQFRILFTLVEKEKYASV